MSRGRPRWAAVYHKRPAVTVSPQTPPLVFGTLEEAIGAVRGRGMRLSTPRRLILEALFAAEGPVSAVHLARTLTVDATSVYRNLEVLERHGLIRHLHLGHGPGLYVLAGQEVEYLYCDRCAKVTPVSAHQLDSLREQLKDSFGYEVRFTHFAIVGLCGPCAQTPTPNADPDDEIPFEDLHGHHHATGHGHVHPAADGHEHGHSHGDHIHSHPHGHDHPTGRHRR